MRADEPTGQGEGVDTGVVDDEELEGLPTVRAVGHQLVTQPVYVIGDLGVVQILPVRPDLAHDRLPELALLLVRQGAL